MSRFVTAFPGGAESPLSDGGNWIAAWALGSIKRVAAGDVENSALATALEGRLYVNAFGSDQSAKVTIGTFNDTGAATMGPLCRGQDITNLRNFYRVNAGRNTTFTTLLNKRVAGTSTDLWSENATTWLAGDVIEVDAVGATISAVRNDVNMQDIADFSLTGAGNVGILMSTTTISTNIVSAFDGGDLTFLQQYEKFPKFLMQPKITGGRLL